MPDPRKQRQVRFAAALDNRNRLPVDIVPERGEHKRQNQLLGQAFDQNDRAGKEEFAARGVELGHHAEVVVGSNWLGLQSTCALRETRSTKMSSSSRTTLRNAGECVE